MQVNQLVTMLHIRDARESPAAKGNATGGLSSLERGGIALEGGNYVEGIMPYSLGGNYGKSGDAVSGGRCHSGTDGGAA